MATLCEEVEKQNSGLKNESSVLTAAQRARAERNRLRARALNDARLVKRPTAGETVKLCTEAGGKQMIDSGGGFFLDEPEATDHAPRITIHPAPIVHPSEQPHCLECDQPFPQSYLYDTFGYSVCDACRDDEEAHSLITRTEAKSEYLLKDCDLDSRPPPLRCIRRRNPHHNRYSEMRLYLRAQVIDRALEVWGSERELGEERERRLQRRDKARRTLSQRRLRALRMDVRSSLYERTRAVHEHAFAAEEYDEAADAYSRTCTTCGHVETYEKM